MMGYMKELFQDRDYDAEYDAWKERNVPLEVPKQCEYDTDGFCKEHGSCNDRCMSE